MTLTPYRISLVALAATLLTPSQVALSQRAGTRTIPLSINDQYQQDPGYLIKLNDANPGEARFGRAPGGVLVEVQRVKEQEAAYRVRIDSKGRGQLADEPFQLIRPGSSTIVRVNRSWPNGKQVVLPYTIVYERHTDSKGIVQDYVSWHPHYRAEGRLTVNNCEALVAALDLNGDGVFDKADFAAGTSIGLDRNGDGRIWGGDEWLKGDQIIAYCGLSFVIAGIEADGSALTLSETDLKIAKIGEPLPEVTLVTTQGKIIRPSDLKGKVVVLDFWASWCVPCVEKFGYLKQLDSELKGRVEIIAINIDEESRIPMASKIIKDRGLTWTQVITGQGAADPVWKTFGSMSGFHLMEIPLYVVVDAEGILRYAGTGGDDLSELRGKVLQELSARRNSKAE